MSHRRFDRIMLAVIGAAVLATSAAAVVSPSPGVIASPRVDFDRSHAEARFLTQGAKAVAPDDAEMASLNGRIGIDVDRGADALADGFRRIGYRLDDIRERGAPVPRVFLPRLPDDLHQVPEVELRKTVFFKTMLPLILKENERILADRRRLTGLKAKTALGESLPARDRLWLMVLAERYRLDTEDIDTLLRRVDIVPPSLAMAQAAEESGWGTSRFARVGNALFGQWTTEGGRGIVPEDRPDGKSYKVRAFDTLAQSVASYMRNLNTHRAYREFRAERKAMRRAGEALRGAPLADTLTRYSARGEAYVKSIRVIIDANNLSALDDARLRDDDDRAA